MGNLSWFPEGRAHNAGRKVGRWDSCLKCLLSYRHRAEVASDVTPTCTFRSFARSFLLVRASIYLAKDESDGGTSTVDIENQIPGSWAYYARHLI